MSLDDAIILTMGYLAAGILVTFIVVEIFFRK